MTPPSYSWKIIVNPIEEEVIMGSIEYGRGMKTKLFAWKAKMDDLIQKVAIRGSKESEKALRKNQDLEMLISNFRYKCDAQQNPAATLFRL